MHSNRFTTFLFLLLFCAAELLSSGTGYGQQYISPDEIQSQLQKAGSNLSPAEIQKGKEMLEQQKTQTKPPDAKEKFAQESGIERADKNQFEQPDEENLFTRTRKTGKYQDISLDLKPFGYQFFLDSAGVAAERKDIPVPLNYIIGSGDQINILLWGRLNAQHSLTVDRDGKITIPQIGPVYVAGMTYEQMSKHVISKAEQIVGTNIDITVGSTRSIPIFVLGDVKKPGAYTVGALATVTDALLMARGPSAIGSLRHVEVRRKNKIITHFDLYDFFLKGDKSKDITLQAGDVVFVPTTGPQVGVAGNVKRPAIYELKDKFDLHHVLELAGGVIPSAYTQQMQVERIIKNEKQVVIDINDKTLSTVKDFVIQDADIVKVFSIVDLDENSVYLNGNVKRPGKYAFKPGMRIRDLVKSTDDLQALTYFEYALIKRESPPNREIVLLPLDLGKLLLQNDEAYNYELTAKDQIFIFNQNMFRDPPFVTVEGEIRGDILNITRDDAKPDVRDNVRDRKQDRKALAERQTIETDIRKDPRLLQDVAPDAAKREGSANREDATKREDAAKLDKKDIEQDQLVLDELGAIKAELQQDPRLYLYVAKIEEIEDEVIAERRPTPGALRYLQIELEKLERTDITARLKKLEKQLQVVRRIDFEGNMRVKDAILRAGGLTPNAGMEKGEIIRSYPNNEYRTTYFNVARAMADDPRHNLILQDKDQIIIHSIWERSPKSSVFVTGDVTSPGVYQYTEKMTVRDLVFKAGNVLESAYLDDAEITSIEIVEGKMGKLVHKNISLRKALEGDPAHNHVLNPNDRLLVRRISDYKIVRTINLSGQIMFTGSYPFKKGERLSDVLERAGGFTQHAYLRGAIFTRLRVRDLQQKGLTEMIDRMERELLSAGTEQLSTASSKEELAAKKVELEQRAKFIADLRQTKATGRMAIYLTDVKTMKGSEYDVELEDGDSLYIPEKSNVVNVMGSVMSQSSHLYSDRLGYEDYINASGGYTYYADPKNVYVLKVDGSARKVSKSFIGWSSSRARWEMTAYGREIRQIEPGDTIVVPEQMERIAWLREIKDITTILMNIAAVTGIMIAAF